MRADNLISPGPSGFNDMIRSASVRTGTIRLQLSTRVESLQRHIRHLQCGPLGDGTNFIRAGAIYPAGQHPSPLSPRFCSTYLTMPNDTSNGISTASAPGADLPSTYRAYTFHSHGDPADVLFLTTLPLKLPSPTQVLIKVHTCALNPISSKLMVASWLPIVQLPCTPELDCSGTVVVVGKEVRCVRVGDAVYGFVGLMEQIREGRGTFGTYALLEMCRVSKLPRGMKMEEAAGLGATGSIALQSLIDDGKLEQGQRVFVNGASGGIGSMAIQIAKGIVGKTGFVLGSCDFARGCTVIELGGDDVIDYTNSPTRLIDDLRSRYSKPNQHFDLILDTVGVDELYGRCCAYLKPTGKYITFGADASSMTDSIDMLATMFSSMARPRQHPSAPREFLYSQLKPTREKFERLNRMVEEGKLRVLVDSKHSFGKREEVLDGYEILMSRNASGKVVVTM
ncbi:hypothetical protein G7K_0939-t1 [Saitoella complicata NRRL Y-17804]|uniref:Enoyl reductase (ER) domain-containing protein n=2 Tax=Saitoella complicata (strain BCRC 22490 / CBS 7301 / JCM 7358 / NBRC 10748 / NRRL Y-17804) TaxID=698492 RepID=A0A0E9NA01_SAICN|nr:hypothetical protein G7K_0939-t1 [Saitoella complicata NRRL Y-17804]